MENKMKTEINQEFKEMAIKTTCTCGVESDPFKLNLIDDAWVDAGEVAHFEFKCPGCSKVNEVKIIWKR